MLRPLRWKLTLAFIFIIFLFVAAGGVGGYFVLRNNYGEGTDRSLQYRMAVQFEFYGYTLPEDLQQAADKWSEELSESLAASGHEPEEGEGHEEVEHENEELHEAQELLEGAYSADLALIFVFPLDESGELLTDPNPFNVPMEPDETAYSAARLNGTDWRTVTLGNGDRVRLYSYRTPGSFGPTVIQLGRSLADQDRVLSQLVLGVSGLGVLLALFVGLSSWWLAGRSLGPAQRAWDQQQAFVANASHELRTPLTLMRANAEVALRGKLGKKERVHLEDIVREADYMGRLVDDLLLLSRLDSGRLHLESESLYLPDLVHDLGRQMETIVNGRRFVASADLPKVSLQADPVRLRQILLILLDNARKHTPAGTSIRLEARLDGNDVVFTVSDDGPGIPAEHLPHIFERFYQAPSEPEGSERSNGLGLSIAQALAALHGGRISAHNAGGAVFDVRIPRSKI